jgi:colanic acid/amylovoran biosynthesis glycosyltransferase
MHVAYLLNVYPRPSQSFIRRELSALESQGVRVTRIAIRSDEQVVDPADLAERQKTRYVLNRGAVSLLLAVARTFLSSPRRFIAAAILASRMGWRSDRGLVAHLAYLAEACVAAGWLASDAVEHVHAHFGTNAATVAMLCRDLGGPPFSFTVHGPEEFDKPQALGLTEKIARSAFVVAVCEFGRSQIFRWARPSDWPKVHVVRCGVDEMFLTASPLTPPAGSTLLSVGRLAEQKGQLILVQAAGELAKRGIDFRLNIVGDGPLRAPLQSMIDRLELRDRVTLCGWKSNGEVRDLLLESRALIMPSFAEGLPVVVMESLALGRPVLSTYIAGIPELVEPGKSGFLVPAGSVSALVDAMETVLKLDAAEMEQLGQVGAARVREQHDAAKEAVRLAGLFARSIRDQRRDGVAAPAGDRQRGTAVPEGISAAPQLD